MPQREQILIALLLTLQICSGVLAHAESASAPEVSQPQSVASLEGAEEILSVDANSRCDATVECGDEIAMAGLIESDVRRRGRWSVLTELTVLLPSYSTETLETANEHPILGPRVSLGWESEAGFGIRGRGWGFESPVDVEQPSQPQNYIYAVPQMISHQIDFSGSRFDLDFYKRIPHRTGDFAIGASITAAHLTLREKYLATSTSYLPYNYQPYYYQPWNSYGYEIVDSTYGDDIIAPPLFNYYSVPSLNLENLESTSTSFSNATFMYTTTYQGGRVLRNRGAGLGLLMEGNHRFYETPHHIWSVFGRGRIAYLIGRWDEPTSDALQQGDGNMTIGEAALGLEYRRPFRYADLTVQCSFEVQSWSVSLADRINLAGVTTGVGLSW